MRFASPNPCCGPIASSVRNTMRSSVPCSTSVDILDECVTVHLECQQETGIDMRAHLRHRSPATLLPPDVARRFVLSKPDEAGVAQVVVERPLHELELPDEHRLQPL